MVGEGGRWEREMEREDVGVWVGLKKGGDEGGGEEMYGWLEGGGEGEEVVRVMYIQRMKLRTY